MANCMIHARGLGPQFWAEAINCANYIQNRTPHKVVQGVAPQEVWSGQKPFVGHLRALWVQCLGVHSKRKTQGNAHAK